MQITSRKIPGTRYELGEFTPTVGLSAKPKKVYLLILNDVTVDRGSKSDLLLMAKSKPGTPLGVCHERYSALAGL